MSLVYTLTAYPAGHLSDRVGRRRILTVGILLLVAADTVLALATGVGTVVAGVALWGAHMGLSQGILASQIADVTAPEYRGTAFGIFNLVNGLGLLAASALAGGLWDAHGPSATFLAGAGLASVALLSTGLLAPRREESGAGFL